MNSTFKPHEYCPELHNKQVWLRVRDLRPRYVRCLLESMVVSYDNATGSVSSLPGVGVKTVDFGGLAGLRGIGPWYFGHLLPVSYEALIDGLGERGIHVHGAPYDWRFGMAQPEEFFAALRGLAEKLAVGGQKVGFLGHGMGANLLHRFLTEYCDEKWRKDVVQSATYVAPAWTGSGQALFALWRLRFPFVHLDFAPLRRFVASMGPFHCQLPNAVAYENTTVVIEADGTRVTGKELVDWLVAKGPLDANQIRIAKENFRFVTTLPKQPDFSVNIVFNSGVRTALGMQLHRPHGDAGQPLYGRGDGLVGSKVTEWACEKWQGEGNRLRCVDLRSEQRVDLHRFMLKTPKTISLIGDLLLGVGAATSTSGFSDEL